MKRTLRIDKRYILIWALALLTVRAVAQTGQCPELPDPAKWTNAEAYAADKERIENILEWLCHTPLGEDVARRSEANACVLDWLAGSPQIRLQIESSVIPGLEGHPELLFPVIHGMALYQIRRTAVADEVKMHTEGLEVLCWMIEHSETLSGEGEFRPMMRAWRRGKLRLYVSDHFTNQK